MSTIDEYAQNVVNLSLILTECIAKNPILFVLVDFVSFFK